MQINDVKEPLTAVRLSQYPIDEKKEFLLLGRSNVGKSSFINTIVERKNHARTSSKPGKTQTLNFYLVNDDFYLVDVPGYGYACASKADRKKYGLMIEDYLRNRENLEKIFLLIDYRHKPTEDDILMYNFLRHYKKDVEIITTKYDKITKNGRIKQDKLIKDALGVTEFIPFSTMTKKGKAEVHEIIASYLGGS